MLYVTTSSSPVLAPSLFSKSPSAHPTALVQVAKAKDHFAILTLCIRSASFIPIAHCPLLEQVINSGGPRHHTHLVFSLRRLLLLSLLGWFLFNSTTSSLFRVPHQGLVLGSHLISNPHLILGFSSSLIIWNTFCTPMFISKLISATQILLLFAVYHITFLIDSSSPSSSRPLKLNTTNVSFGLLPAPFKLLIKSPSQ